MVNVESNAAAHFSDDDHDYCNTYRCPIISRAESQRTQAGYSSEGTKHVAGRERKQETFSRNLYHTTSHAYVQAIHQARGRQEPQKKTGFFSGQDAFKISRAELGRVGRDVRNLTGRIRVGSGGVSKSHQPGRPASSDPTYEKSWKKTALSQQLSQKPHAYKRVN